ncbi:MAG: hydroxymethylbilane synthase [Legionellales bacterium]|nr:hydroxymethylbilane synthase [Legionellales bacterium]
MKIRIATRKSKLAIVQTQLIIQKLQQAHPSLTFEMREVQSAGDQILDQSLAELGGKGLFVKTLEEELLANRADIAMHSLKDVPPELNPQFTLCAVLARHSPHDVLVSPHYSSLAALPAGASVGTCSVRRKAALLHQRPDLTVKMIRGNVDTRLNKLHAGEFTALILAEAGLTRLGLESHVQEVLPINTFTPSVGQGVIAIECLSARQDLLAIVDKIHDPETFTRICAERALNRTLQASCTSPVGSFAQMIEGSLQLMGVVWNANGTQRIEVQQTGNSHHPEALGIAVAQALLQKGAARLLQE